jgi:hypothetical protein
MSSKKLNKKSKDISMGFPGWLTLTFIILKLTGFVDWSWWWVASPILISILFDAFLGGLIGVLNRKETDTQKDLKNAFKILNRMEKNNYK